MSVEQIESTLLHLPPEERFWRLQFMAGAMSHVLALSAALPRMSGSSGQPLDRPALIRRMTEFLAAGLRAPFSSVVIKRGTVGIKRRTTLKTPLKTTSRREKK